MDFYPLTWNYDENNEILKCRGILNKNREIDLTIPLTSSYLLVSAKKIIKEDAKDIMESLSASKLYLSNIDDKVIILRNPIVRSKGDWVSIETDPVGKITSFFHSVSINPYEPFTFNSYSQEKEITINENMIIPNPSLQREKDILKRLYWDIEVVTPRKEFVYAKYIDNHIISISLVYKDSNIEKLYFLYWGSYQIENPNFTSIRFSNEKDTILHFFKLIKELNPNRMYTYNGDSFDIPYLAERCFLHSIYDIRFTRKRIKGRFQWENVMVFDTPEIEHLDFLRIMLKFYEGLPNYKLETIGRLFLGEGKTGLDIHEMFLTFYTQRREGMEDFAKYSVKDSILLKDLNEKLKLDYLMETVSNSCGIINSMILNIPDYQLAEKCAYMTDPGSHNMSGELIKNYFSSSIKQNFIYKDIHIYDYSIYYSIEMQSDRFDRSDDQNDRVELQYNYDLSLRSLELPPRVKADLYWSQYFKRRPKSVIDQLSEQENVLEITGINIKSIGPLDDMFPGSLIVLQRFTHYLQLGKVSYVARTLDGNIVKVGTKGVLKPKFKRASEYLNEVLKYIFEDIDEVPQYFLDAISDVSEYLIDMKLKDIDEYPAGTDKHKLAQQFGDRIKTWTNVKYYETEHGPILEEFYNDEELNMEYYEKQLKEIKKLLKYKS